MGRVEVTEVGGHHERHELPAAGTDIPRHVSILAGQWPSRGGYLGAQYDAFQTGDPAGPVPDTVSGLPPGRVELIVFVPEA